MGEVYFTRRPRLARGKSLKMLSTGVCADDAYRLVTQTDPATAPGRLTWCASTTVRSTSTGDIPILNLRWETRWRAGDNACGISDIQSPRGDGLSQNGNPVMFTATTRCTGVTSHAGVLVTTLVLLSGAAILRGGAATADSNEDDQFLALLAQEGIPALEGVPSLVDVAHKVCRALDAGIPADRVLDAMVEYAGSNDPPERFYAPGRLARTEARFITASVGAYCPYNRSKITFLVTDPASRWNDPAHRMADNNRNAVNSRDDLREPHVSHRGALATGRCAGERLDFDVHGAALASSAAAVPAGDVTQPSPPQLPAPPPSLAHQAPPKPIAAPPRPQRVSPPPQQPPPLPRVAPRPGAAPGNGGGGSTGGDLPAAPPPPPVASPPPVAPPPPPPVPPAPPAPPMAPGFVRLAP
ncbi:DUF732 domain-containing protein [Mycobacterium colombiense]|uniref:DUF732 domain-containing protein n=1 Tax=Mycobacterium colombiense TaxID=339268 RepID=UPI0022ABC539|nr:DUF732 domain-containing protein [Mycobacterium colombiense]